MIGNKIQPFKIWCQKVLPNVYDDSLSYYEYLCKMNEYLNEVIEQMNTLTEAEEEYQEALTQAWNETKNYIDNYFNNLDVQNEINNKLDAMALDGTLSSLISPFVSQEIGGVVAEQIGSTVASQIGNTVANQIDDVVAEQIGEPASSATTAWLTEHVTPVGSAVIVDDSLTISGAAADAKATGTQIKNIRDNMPLEDITYPYSGYINTSGTVVANANFFYSDFIDVKTIDINTFIYCHPLVATFTFYDSNKDYLNEYIKTSEINAGMEEHILDIPNDAVYVIVCTDPTYSNKVYKYMNIKNALVDVYGTDENYGNDGRQATNFISGFLNFTACPCKKAEDSGKIEKLYVKSYASGVTKVYIGEVDQLLLFVPRTSFDVSVASGEQFIDVSDLNMYIKKGEQVLYRFIGQTPFVSISGSPEADDSFYYSQTGTLQLVKYGDNTKSAIFGFGYTITSSTNYKQDIEIIDNNNKINNVQEVVTELQSNMNIVSDRSGNKYKMIVENGQIVPIPLNFRHILCVGNSYTIHPTTTDSEPDYSNNLWWGHWAMASSSKDTAWTTLLQTAIRQKINDAVVTPVFGRRYETSPTVYNLYNANTFTYWDGTAWQSLSNNLASFSDVDAIVFFLGANYSGNDWYTLYKAMVEKFITWFPNANIFCCSCSYFAMTEKDNAIKNVADEEMGTYINLVGVTGLSRIGSYVKGDDNNLHQITNAAVGNHFGDYGEYNILNRVCNAIGYQNNATLYDINITNVSGVTLTVISTKTTYNSIVSVFAEVGEGVTLSSITVVDASNNNVSVTDHGTTGYGRIFTFTMPNSNVSITPIVA